MRTKFENKALLPWEARARIASELHQAARACEDVDAMQTATKILKGEKKSLRESKPVVNSQQVTGAS